MTLWILVAAIGLVAGILSGIFGIGGGLIIVPALVLVGGWTVTQAAGTSLGALLLPVGLLGAYEYWRAGHVNVAAAAILAGGFSLGRRSGPESGWQHRLKSCSAPSGSCWWWSASAWRFSWVLPGWECDDRGDTPRRHNH